MTREEGTAKLATLRESVEEQVKTYNDAVRMAGLRSPPRPIRL